MIYRGDYRGSEFFPTQSQAYRHEGLGRAVIRSLYPCGARTRETAQPSFDTHTVIRESGPGRKQKAPQSVLIV